jgi:hypothetical protein
MREILSAARKKPATTSRNAGAKSRRKAFNLRTNRHTP